MKDSHSHVISCLLGELRVRLESTGQQGEPIRVLDAGCGSGGLIADICDISAASKSLGRIEVYGFEVLEHAAARESFSSRLLSSLGNRHPDIDWGNRVRVVSAVEAWPFEDGFFDFVVSNQVLEHVRDLGWFLEQHRRTLKPSGVGIHHFPSSKIIVDPHSGIPFAHWPGSDAARTWIIRFFSRLGIGKFPKYRQDRGQSLDEFVAEFVNYLREYTAFRSPMRVAKTGGKAGLSTRFNYNASLLKREINGDSGVYPYCNCVADIGVASVLTFAASVTLVCRRR